MRLLENQMMDKNKIITQHGLIAHYPSFDFLATAKVISFKMSIVGNGVSEEISTKGNMLTQPMKDRLQRLRKNERLIFEEIIAVGPNGKQVPLNDLVIKVN